MVRMRYANKCELEFIIVPVDREGKLNAASFFNGREKLSKLQQSMIDHLSPLGPKPVRKSAVADYRTIDDYFEASDSYDIQAPEPLEGESAGDYYARAQKAYVDRGYQILDRLLSLKHTENELQTYIQRLLPGNGKGPIGTPGEHIEDMKARIDRLDNIIEIRDYWRNLINNIKSSGLPQFEIDRMLKIIYDAANKARNY